MDTGLAEVRLLFQAQSHGIPVRVQPFDLREVHAGLRQIHAASRLTNWWNAVLIKVPTQTPLEYLAVLIVGSV